MPRKRKQVSYNEDSDNEEESEWEAEGEGLSDEELEYEEEAEESSSSASSEEKKPPPKRKQQKKTGTRSPTRNSPAKKPAAKSRTPPNRPHVEYEISSEEEDFVPSHARKTDHGGYSHTQKSRLRISKANRGNVPWNKGKNRSATDRSKIAAGVRARNRERLQKKLKQLGMTEEEYCEKTKEIKYYRERLRRARVNTKKHKEKVAAAAAKRRRKEMAAQKIGESSEAQRAEDGVVYEVDVEGSVDQQGSAPALMQQGDHVVGSADGHEAAAVGEGVPPQVSAAAASNDKDEPLHPMFAMFAPEIHWTPHPFDDEKVSYTNTCPNGGPGGLICCSVCTATYSRYLSSTHKEFEQQASSKIARDLEQLVGLMSNAKTRLGQALRAARRKPPPGNKKGGGVTKDGKAKVDSSK